MFIQDNLQIKRFQDFPFNESKLCLAVGNKNIKLLSEMNKTIKLNINGVKQPTPFQNKLVR